MKSRPTLLKNRFQSEFQIKLINEPDDYALKLKLENPGINLVRTLHNKVDVIQLFVKSKKELLVELGALKNYLTENGLLIVAWPDYSNTVTDLNELIVIELAKNNQLSTNRVFSLIKNWTAIEFTNSKMSVK